MLDLVYALGTGSTWNDTELKYSLRSFEKFMPNMGNVYIVGQKPNWIKPKSVIHLLCEDRPGKENKEQNIAVKILLACNQPAISEKFVFANDDHFILQPMHAIPYYKEGTLEKKIIERVSHDNYFYSLCNTRQVLIEARKRTNYFDIHTPIVYDKKEFISVMASYDWTVNYGYVVKSLYCNTLGIKGVEIPDLKITERLKCGQIDRLVAGKKVFSIGDGAVNAEMGTFLQYLYPSKSKYEV
jgi:hypothetical protein